jgi:hypothetical protein
LPSTITLSWPPSSVIFTSRSIFLYIPKLTSGSSSFFGLCCQKVLKSIKKRWRSISGV